MKIKTNSELCYRKINCNPQHHTITVVTQHTFCKAIWLLLLLGDHRSIEEKCKVLEQNDEIDTMNNVVCFLYFRLFTEDLS